MGVYHLMGLGRSPGAITGPLSYLAFRFQRWNGEDQRFFARSGEQAQRQDNKKVGDVQALILFTTAEVLQARDDEGNAVLTYPYIENQRGKTIGQDRPPGAMKDTLVRLLTKFWPEICGGRKQGTIFWCEIDRRNIYNVYDRVVRVVSALANVGGQGKEIWVNLTGGNNVTNFALELTGSLSGQVARQYYVQARNPTAEKCAYYTAEEGYWVELPMLPLALGRLRREIINLLAARGPCSADDLYSVLRNDYWDLVRGVDSVSTLRDEYLAPLWRQGLMIETAGGYAIGPQWELIQPYEEMLQTAQRGDRTIEQLAQQESWITMQEILLGAAHV